MCVCLSICGGVVKKTPQFIVAHQNLYSSASFIKSGVSFVATCAPLWVEKAGPLLLTRLCSAAGSAELTGLGKRTRRLQQLGRTKSLKYTARGRGSHTDAQGSGNGTRVATVSATAHLDLGAIPSYCQWMGAWIQGWVEHVHGAVFIPTPCHGEKWLP